MELAQVSLILADISGYTSFISMHRISLLHAEQIVTELLEAIISQIEAPLILNKLEGDAVFSMPTPGIKPAWLSWSWIRCWSFLPPPTPGDRS